MDGLFPIIRRKRKPLIEVAPPAPISEPVKPAVTPPPAPPPAPPEKITPPDEVENTATTEKQ